MRCGALAAGRGQRADALDPGLHDVAALEEFLPRQADAGGRAGRDQVARLQGDEGRQMGDLLGQREDHLAGMGVLLDDVVDPELEADGAARQCMALMKCQGLSPRLCGSGSGLRFCTLAISSMWSLKLAPAQKIPPGDGTGGNNRMLLSGRPLRLPAVDLAASRMTPRAASQSRSTSSIVA